MFAMGPGFFETQDLTAYVLSLNPTGYWHYDDAPLNVGGVQPLANSATTNPVGQMEISNAGGWIKNLPTWNGDGRVVLQAPGLIAGSPNTAVNFPASFGGDSRNITGPQVIALTDGSPIGFTICGLCNISAWQGNYTSNDNVIFNFTDGSTHYVALEVINNPSFDNPLLTPGTFALLVNAGSGGAIVGNSTAAIATGENFFFALRYPASGNWEAYLGTASSFAQIMSGSGPIIGAHGQALYTYAGYVGFNGTLDEMIFAPTVFTAGQLQTISALSLG